MKRAVSKRSKKRFATKMKMSNSRPRLVSAKRLALRFSMPADCRSGLFLGVFLFAIYPYFLTLQSDAFPTALPPDVRRRLRHAGWFENALGYAPGSGSARSRSGGALQLSRSHR